MKGWLLSPDGALCLSCGKLRGQLAGLPLCPACARELVRAPYRRGLLCPRCQSVMKIGKPCPFCARDKEGLLSRTFAPYRYHGAPRSLVLSLKFRGDTRAAALLAPAMARSLRGTDWDALVPVPLSVQRLRERGFNQARELAELTGVETGLPVSDLLVRVRKTGRQTDLHTRRDRILNVRDAFAPAPGADCAGKRVLLVDDVRTTGATALSCAGVLRQMGAAEVGLLAACVAPGLIRGRGKTAGRVFRRKRGTE